MGNAASLVRWDFIGGDVEAFVDLHFVRVDDLSFKKSSEVD